MPVAFAIGSLPFAFANRSTSFCHFDNCLLFNKPDIKVRVEYLRLIIFVTCTSMIVGVEDD